MRARETIPAGAEGYWRPRGLLHPPNIWRPPLEYVRLALVLRRRPRHRRLQALCAAGHPCRGDEPAGGGRPDRAGLRPESEAIWDRWDERPIPLQPRLKLQRDRPRTVAGSHAKPSP